MSESILLLNPRRRRRSSRRRRARSRRGRMPAGLRRYWASRRASNPRRRRRHARRRHTVRLHRRRRASAVGPVRRRRRSNPRRRYVARRRHRNPRRMFARASGYGRGILGQYVIPGAVGASGGVLMDVIWGYVSPRLPAQLQAGWAALAAKLGVVIGVAYGVNRVRPGMRTQVHAAAVGAATVALYGALKGLAQSVLPASIPGLSGYMDYQSYALPGSRMGGYMPRAGGLGDLGDFFSPAAVIQPMGTPVPRQFGGYIAAQPHVSGNGGLMGYDWSNDGM